MEPASEDDEIPEEIRPGSIEEVAGTQLSSTFPRGPEPDRGHRRPRRPTLAELDRRQTEETIARRRKTAGR